MTKPATLSSPVSVLQPVVMPHRALRMSRQERKQLRNHFTVQPVWDAEALLDAARTYRQQHPPLPSSDDQHFESDRSSYGEAVAVLEAAGFVNIHHLESVGFRYDFVPEDAASPKNIQDWWVHPAGVFARSSSYGTASNGQPGFNSVDINAQVNLGFGRLTFFASNHVQQCSSSHTLSSSGWIHKTQYSANQCVDQIVSHLDQLQQSGHMLPLASWSDDAFVCLPVKNLVVVEDYPSLRDQPEHNKRLLGELYAQTALDIVGRQPDDVAQFLRQAFAVNMGLHSGEGQHIMDYAQEVIKGMSLWPTPEQLQRRREQQRWRIVEPSLKYIDQVAGDCFQRFWPHHECDIVQHWCSLVEDPPKALDVQRDHLQAKLTGGVHLGNMLAHQLFHLNADNGRPDLLLALIQTVDRSVLVDWCSVPDASGCTLPMVLMNNLVLCGEQRQWRQERYLLYLERASKVREALLERLSPHELVMHTSSMSAQGAWAMALAKQSTDCSWQDLQDLLTPWREAGVDVGDRWAFHLPFHPVYDDKHHRWSGVAPPRAYDGDNAGSFMDAFPMVFDKPHVVRALMATAVHDALKDPHKEASRKKIM